jgi:hypothetical protein
MANFTSKFLVLVLSTFHSSTIHILKSNPLKTGGKDMSESVATKCFLKSRNSKRPNRLTGMYFSEKNYLK